MPALLLASVLASTGGAFAADRADKLGAKADALYEAGKTEAARAAAQKSVAVRDNFAALSVLVLIHLEDVQAPLPQDEGAERAELDRRAQVLGDSMSRLEAVRPDAVALGIARTMLGIWNEGEILPAPSPECPPEAKARFDAAEAAFGRHDPAAALAAYEDALALCPNESTWWVYSGDALHMQGNLRGAVARYERALEIEPCHHVAHRFAADVMMGYPDLTETEASKLTQHALDAVVCNPHYDASWSTLGALVKGADRRVDLRVNDPQGYDFLVSRSGSGPGDALDRREAAARAVLAEGAPDTPLWTVLGMAEKVNSLRVAVAFETLDRDLADAYRAHRLEMVEGLRAWVYVTRLQQD